MATFIYLDPFFVNFMEKPFLCKSCIRMSFHYVLVKLEALRLVSCICAVMATWQ